MPTIGNNLLPYPNTSDEPNVPKAISDLASAVDAAIGGGSRIYQTLAALQAVPSTQLFEGMRARVTADTTNNGEYVYAGGSWLSAKPIGFVSWPALSTLQPNTTWWVKNNTPDATSWGVGGCTIAANGITVPRAGIYRVNAMYSFAANSSGRRGCGYTRNAGSTFTPMSGNMVVASAGTQNATSLPDPVRLAAGDVVSSCGYQDSGNPIAVGASSISVEFLTEAV